MAGKALMWVKNITNFGRFCFLNIPCLRINITLILYEFFKRWIHALVRKLKNRCLLVSGGHICAPQRNTNMASPYKALLNLGKTFFRISRIWNIAQTWFLARPLHIYLLLFPRFWTFCIEWFAILFLIAWQWKPRFAAVFVSSRSVAWRDKSGC